MQLVSDCAVVEQCGEEVVEISERGRPENAPQEGHDDEGFRHIEGIDDEPPSGM